MCETKYVRKKLRGGPVIQVDRQILRWRQRRARIAKQALLAATPLPKDQKLFLEPPGPLNPPILPKYDMPELFFDDEDT